MLINALLVKNVLFIFPYIKTILDFSMLPFFFLDIYNELTKNKYFFTKLFILKRKTTNFFYTVDFYNIL